MSFREKKKSGIDVIMNALGTVEGQDRGFVDAKLVPGRPVWSPPKDGRIVAEVRHEFGFEFKLSYPNCWVCWIVCLDSHGLYCCTFNVSSWDKNKQKRHCFLKDILTSPQESATETTPENDPTKQQIPFCQKLPN